jgi:hypothetical protein
MTKTLSFTSGNLGVAVLILLGVLSFLATLSLPKGAFLIIFVFLFFVAISVMMNVRYVWFKFKI